MQIKADFVITPIPRYNLSKKGQSPPVEVPLPEGGVLLPLQGLVGVSAPGRAESRPCPLPGPRELEKEIETQMILSMTT